MQSARIVKPVDVINDSAGRLFICFVIGVIDFFDFETFEKAHLVIQEMHNLLEASFGGLEAQKVKAMVEETALLEHQTACVKRKLEYHLFSIAENLEHYIFYLWLNLFEQIARLSKLAEKLANRIRMILEVS